MRNVSFRHAKRSLRISAALEASWKLDAQWGTGCFRLSLREARPWDPTTPPSSPHPPRHKRSTDRRPSPPHSPTDGRPDRASRLTRWRAQKLRKRALKPLKLLARVNLCGAASSLVQAVKSKRNGRISTFLVNQTFRKPQSGSALALTCVSPFHTMNKQGTFCGEVQAGLFRNNAAHAGSINLRLETAERSARC
jgi:hypothetical protein